MRPPGPWEIGLILVIILIIFGVGKLPQVGAAFGKSIRAFKKGQSDEEEEEEEEKPKRKRKRRKRKVAKKVTAAKAEEKAGTKAEEKAEAEAEEKA